MAMLLPRTKRKRKQRCRSGPPMDNNVGKKRGKNVVYLFPHYAPFSN